MVHIEFVYVSVLGSKFGSLFLVNFGLLFPLFRMQTAIAHVHISTATQDTTSAVVEKVMMIIVLVSISNIGRSDVADDGLLIVDNSESLRLVGEILDTVFSLII